MKLCYQAATPDVAIADSVTAYQGSLTKTFGDLGALGYDGVELMTLNPGKLDWREVKETAEENNLSVVLVCTGEIFGQLGLSYTHHSRLFTFRLCRVRVFGGLAGVVNLVKAAARSPWRVRGVLFRFEIGRAHV